MFLKNCLDQFHFITSKFEASWSLLLHTIFLPSLWDLLQSQNQQITSTYCPHISFFGNILQRPPQIVFHGQLMFLLGNNCFSLGKKHHQTNKCISHSFQNSLAGSPCFHHKNRSKLFFYFRVLLPGGMLPRDQPFMQHISAWICSKLQLADSTGSAMSCLFNKFLQTQHYSQIPPWFFLLLLDLVFHHVKMWYIKHSFLFPLSLFSLFPVCQLWMSYTSNQIDCLLWIFFLRSLVSSWPLICVWKSDIWWLQE